MRRFDPIVFVYGCMTCGQFTYPCLLIGFAAGVLAGWVLFG